MEHGEESRSESQRTSARHRNAPTLGDSTSDPILISDNVSSDDEDSDDMDDARSETSGNTSDPPKSLYIFALGPNIFAP